MGNFQYSGFDLSGRVAIVLLSACIRHFDRTWDIVKARNDVKQV
jgi:hypothetical protein